MNKHLRKTPIALVALFFALGGTSHAAAGVPHRQQQVVVNGIELLPAVQMGPITAGVR